MNRPADDDAAGRLFMSKEAYAQNMRSIDMTRTLLTLLTGAVIGVANVTGLLKGLGFYAASYAFVSLVIASRMGFATKRYTDMTLPKFIFSGAGNYGLTFVRARRRRRRRRRQNPLTPSAPQVLFWTLFYTLVYVY